MKSLDSAQAGSPLKTVRALDAEYVNVPAPDESTAASAQIGPTRLSSKAIIGASTAAVTPDIDSMGTVVFANVFPRLSITTYCAWVMFPAVSFCREILILYPAGMETLASDAKLN